jgi:hypothetical protein
MGLQLRSRFFYQVALASCLGFTIPAQEFAAVHRIPLLSFASTLFQPVTRVINELEQIEPDKSDAKALVQYFQNDNETGFENTMTSSLRDWCERYESAIDQLSERAVFGFLENGSMLFLFKQSSPDVQYKKCVAYGDGFSISWADEYTKHWHMQVGKDQYDFELPDELMRAWVYAKGNGQEERTVNIELEEFRHIVFMHITNGNVNIKVQKIPATFIEDVRKELNKEHE